MSQVFIVPLDGSERAEAALPWAALLARTQGLPLVLLRVVPPAYLVAPGFDGALPYLSPETYDRLEAAEREAAASYLAAVQARLAADGIAVETVTRTGLPAETILDVADERGAAAIVLATHGRGGLTRLVLGSVAERVVAQATTPLLLVRAAEGAVSRPAELSRLLVPLDGSALAERALDLAAAIAPPGATRLLLRVVAPVERAMPGVGAAGTYIDVEATERATAAADAYLDEVRQRLSAGGYAVQTAVRRGQPAAEILAAAREAAASLIVLSTHGRTGPRRWLLGSVADAVVRGADSPVFLVSARALVARAQTPYAVRDLMTRDLAVVRADEPLTSALRKLLRHRVSGAPVVDATGKLVGVLSEHDLLAWDQGLLDLLAGDPGMPLEDYRRRVATARVSDIMSRSPVTVDEDAPLNAAMRTLVHHAMRRLPVVRDGRLVGILTRADVLRALAAQLEAVAETPWATVAGGTPPPTGQG
ncbi:MAG TPA: universal stress protein [Chloroflexota bacterium]|nr:universal stress protein [Chloroflexota bacterium]